MSEYDINSIEVLSPQEHIKRRKGMYIGDGTDPSHLFNEILDNALDESSAGYSHLTEVVVDYPNNTYSVTDHGRGFPQGMIYDPVSGKYLEVVELLATTSFSGGKFSSNIYRISSGIHGLGLLVTSSLSSSLRVITWRDHSEVDYLANEGYKVNINKGYTDKDDSGTKVDFIPNPNMFEESKIPLSHIITRLKIASAFGMKNTLKVIEDNVNERIIDTSSDIYDLLPQSDEGVSEYYKYDFIVKDEDTGEYVAIALQYTSDTKTYYRGYTNLLYNSQGGSHHKMLDQALWDAWSNFDLGVAKLNDTYLGLRAVVAVFITEPAFSSQSKEKLSVKKDRLDKLKGLVSDEIVKWLKDNDDIRNSLIKRFQEYRESQNKLLSRKEIKSLLYVNDSKNGQIKRKSIVRKLRDCDSRSREGTELLIPEGESAAGSIIQARDSRMQAVLPVRGKVLNVSRLDNLVDCLKNEEIRSMINSIGAGLGEDADPDKSRYDKIIFYTDRDADGCFTGDTEIKVVNGDKEYYTFEELVNNGMDNFLVYSRDKHMNLRVGKAKNPHITKYVSGLVEMRFSDGYSIRCTDDHRILMVDGRYKKAGDLASDDKISSLYLWTTNKSGFWTAGRPISTYQKIVSIEHTNLDNPIPVYDMEVEEYHNFIIRSSQDSLSGIFVHNSEIRVLLSGIFIKLLPRLVKAGMVYIAESPLYGWRDNKGKMHYEIRFEDVPKDRKELKRFKGLGELNPDEIWESCLNPETRRLIRVNYPEDINSFNSILTSSSVKFKMLEDEGVIRYEGG